MMEKTWQQAGKAWCEEKEDGWSHCSCTSCTGNELGFIISRPNPSDPLPLVRLHLLKVLQSSKIVPLVGDQLLKHVSLWEKFHT